MKIPYSHEGIARTDRIYLSQDLISEISQTSSVYIGSHKLQNLILQFSISDNPGQNDHCVVTISLDSSVPNNEEVGMKNQENGVMMINNAGMEEVKAMQSETLAKLEDIIKKLQVQDKEIENIKNSLKDIKARI